METELHSSGVCCSYFFFLFIFLFSPSQLPLQHIEFNFSPIIMPFFEEMKHIDRIYMIF